MRVMCKVFHVAVNLRPERFSLIALDMSALDFLTQTEISQISFAQILRAQLNQLILLLEVLSAT